MSGHGALLHGCDSCLKASEDVAEVQGGYYCDWCRDQLRVCDGCSEPMVDAQSVPGDETRQYRVCSDECAERVIEDVACVSCARIPEHAEDIRMLEWWDAESGRYEGGHFCRHCR